MESNRMTAALLLFLTFALGLSLGFIIHSQLFAEGDRRPLRGPGGPNIGREGLLPPQIRERVAEELGLTPDQSEEFDRILENHRQKTLALRQDVIQPRQRAISDSTRLYFERLLTPEQMQRFRRFRQSFRPGQFRGPPDGMRGGPRRPFDR